MDVDQLTKDVQDMGIILSSSKIWEKIKTLRYADETIKQNLSRRWVWELIQNAKDSSNDKVTIEIILKNEDGNRTLNFSHNGTPFTCKGLLSLVMQTSFKEKDEDNSSTGKFGTGFITTHLLSEKVVILGVVEDYKGIEKQLNLVIDRTGVNREEIERAITESVNEIKLLDTEDFNHQFKNLKYKTNFVYHLNNDGVSVAKDGFRDLDCSVMFTLAFVPIISSIKINNKAVEYKLLSETNFQDYQIYKVEKISSPNSVFDILTLTNELTSIALLFEKKEETIFIKPFNSLTPKLFCDFPLIGTEQFSFPVIINNRNFEVTEPRDGILLGKEENQQILFKAMDLFKSLLKMVSVYRFRNIHYLCMIPKSSNEWLNKNIVQPMLDICFTTPIVDVGNQNGELEPFWNFSDEQNILLPYNADPDLQNQLWELCNKLKMIYKIPVKSELDNWVSIINDEKYKYTIIRLAKFIADLKSLNSLNDVMINTSESKSWLNEFYQLLNNSKKNWGSFVDLDIYLNQDGDFKKISQLKIDNNIDEELKDILLDFDVNIRAELVDKYINLDNYEVVVVDNTYISKIIVDKIYEQLRIENSAGREERDDKIKNVFEKILLWFDKYNEQAKILFGDVYLNSYKLINNSDVIKNIQMSNELKKIINKFDLKNGISDIEKVLEEKSKSEERQKITKESLLSLGVSTEQDFLTALENEEIRDLFDHESKATTEMWEYVTSIIERSKERVIAYLMTLPEIYDCGEYEKSSQTIITGIKKYGKSIKIVVRPSDGDKIILYHKSEYDTLDYEDYELWIDNGRDNPKYLTLGKILKITGINSIPLKKLFY